MTHTSIIIDLSHCINFFSSFQEFHVHHDAYKAHTIVIHVINFQLGIFTVTYVVPYKSFFQPFIPLYYPFLLSHYFPVQGYRCASGTGHN